MMAADLPPMAVQYLPVLSQEAKAHWPGVPYPSKLAGQVDKETCISPKHRKCWNPRTELKVVDRKTGGLREYGFGLGQLTVTAKFDNFKEAKSRFSALNGWVWENRYDARYQLRTMVLMMKFNYGKLSWAATQQDQYEIALASYNGGLGGVLSDRTVCRVTPGCDPTRWFNHIEDTSKKAKVAVHGYGESFFQINRRYVREVMCLRSTKYEAAMGDTAKTVCPPKH